MRHRLRVFIGTIAFTLIAAGCGSLESARQPDLQTGADTFPRVHFDANWMPCPLNILNDEGPQGECARFDVPLRWRDPGGDTITVFLQRLKGTGSGVHGQLWMLAGGPGGSGAEMAPLAEVMAPLLPHFDIYLLDHRGVGRSTRLGCPMQEAAESDYGIQIIEPEWPPCMQYLRDTWQDDFDAFNVTEAALDVGRFIEALRAPDQEVFVIGYSYGTYWAHRYLQLFPDQAAGVILDSILPPNDKMFLTQWDTRINQYGRTYLELCAADAFCAGKLGGDPWAVLQGLYSKLDAGHCRSLRTVFPAYLRDVLGFLMHAGGRLRVFVPALIYRLQRCHPADSQALMNLVTTLSTPSAEGAIMESLASAVLGNHIFLSEIWAQPSPTPEELQAAFEDTLIADGLGPRYARLYEPWPKYPRDEHYGTLAQTETPLLMMHAELDQPALLDAMRTHFGRPGQHFLMFPRSQHILTQPLADGGVSCGQRILLDFLEDPQSDPNTSCFERIPKIDFRGDNALVEQLMQTVDLWENE